MKHLTLIRLAMGSTAIIALTAPAARAGEAALMRVRNAATGAVYDFKASTDDTTGELQGLNYYLPNGRKFYYSTDDLKRNPVFMKESKFGVSKTITQCRNAKLDGNGGTLSLRLLRQYEILKKDDYRSILLEVKREGTTWKMYINDQSGRREYTTLLMYANIDGDGEQRGIARIAVQDDGTKLEMIDTDELERG